MKTTKNLALTLVLSAIFFSVSIFAQNDPVKNQIKEQTQTQEMNQVQSQNKNLVHGNRFIDLNNDGYNDNAPDADGDGIPNGRDEDYSGAKNRNGNNGQKGFVDLNSDGINDNAVDSDGDGIPNGQDPDYVKPNDGTGQQNRNGKGNKNHGKMWGLNDGTGNNGIGPKDGTGYGSGSGSGNCDGTGPKRGGRK
jgi:hypothetical protein